MKQDCKNCICYVKGDQNFAPFCSLHGVSFRFGSVVCDRYKDNRIFTVAGKYTETFINWLLCK